MLRKYIDVQRYDFFPEQSVQTPPNLHYLLKKTHQPLLLPHHPSSSFLPLSVLGGFPAESPFPLHAHPAPILPHPLPITYLFPRLSLISSPPRLIPLFSHSPLPPIPSLPPPPPPFPASLPQISPIFPFSSHFTPSICEKVLNVSSL